VFTPAEAHAYLTAKLSGHPQSAQGAAGLADDVGFLPLALAQAVAYLTNRGWTCQHYRDRLADHRRTLRQVLPQPGELPDDYTATVAATFALSLNLANELEPVGVAGPVMLLACLLDPAGIPLPVFGTNVIRVHLSAVVQQPVEAEEVDEVLGVLHRLSLLTLDRHNPRRAVQIHTLVQRATREDPDHTPDALTTAARATADAVLEIWPEVERDTELMAALRSNIRALQIVAEPALWTPDGHTVLFRAGTSLGEAGQLTDAIVYYQHLHTAAHTYLGSDHPDTLITRGNLAFWWGIAGGPAGAVAAFTELLADQQRILGAEHPDTLTIRKNLARWRGEAGDPSGAAEPFTQLLADWVRMVGSDHPGVKMVRDATVYWQQRAIESEH
jgi:hypothetical protein